MSSNAITAFACGRAAATAFQHPRKLDIRELFHELTASLSAMSFVSFSTSPRSFSTSTPSNALSCFYVRQLLFRCLGLGLLGSHALSVFCHDFLDYLFIQNPSRYFHHTFSFAATLLRGRTPCRRADCARAPANLYQDVVRRSACGLVAFHVLAFRRQAEDAFDVRR